MTCDMTHAVYLGSFPQLFYFEKSLDMWAVFWQLTDCVCVCVCVSQREGNNFKKVSLGAKSRDSIKPSALSTMTTRFGADRVKDTGEVNE